MPYSCLVHRAKQCDIQVVDVPTRRQNSNEGVKDLSIFPVVALGTHLENIIRDYIEVARFAQ